ncbi:transposase [Maribacter confluentis]|uniref:Transposase n=1 Tax=Maribacter confluentis TaxID=1656093 RepID=A0ABT8RNA3_9FLAO|nr:transposase [Maribacter confluentis]MDO1512389.1 transposase [Maribacter confluentis]
MTTIIEVIGIENGWTIWYSQIRPQKQLWTAVCVFCFLDLELWDVLTQLRRSCIKHHKKGNMVLRSIHGIGAIVNCGILCELDEIRRFNSIKHLEGYVGFAPGVHQSGGNSRTLGLTPHTYRFIKSNFV